MDDFEIADGRLAARAPIDHVAAAIDQAFAIEAQKGFEHGAIERGLERESLARPIAGRAEANHLLLDDAAAFRFPLPDAPLEFFAAQILAADSFLGELRSTTNCVAIPAWSMPGSQSVRWPRMRCQRTSMSICVCSSMWPMWIEPVMLGGGSAIENRGPSAGIFGAEKFFVEPGLGPALFDFLRLVSLGNFPWHGFLVQFEFSCRGNNQYKREAEYASIRRGG